MKSLWKRSPSCLCLLFTPLFCPLLEFSLSLPLSCFKFSDSTNKEQDVYGKELSHDLMGIVKILDSLVKNRSNMYLGDDGVKELVIICDHVHFSCKNEWTQDCVQSPKGAGPW